MHAELELSTRSLAAEIVLEGTCVVESGVMWELYNSIEKKFRI